VRKKCVAAAALALLIAASDATAARFTGVTSQKDTGLALELRHQRVMEATLHFTMDCEDGTSIARSAVLRTRTKLARGRRFRLTGDSGGMTVVMSGRLTGARRAEGTFEASTDACFTGVVGWVGARE
jgi:hypothetical protein